MSVDKQLCDAALHGDIVTMQQLYSEMQVDDSSSYLALCNASMKGHVEIVKLALNNFSATFDITKDDDPFLYACNHGHLDVVKFFVNRGAAVNRFMCEGSEDREYNSVYPDFLLTKHEIFCWLRNPLIVASSMGHLEIVRFLLKKGADMHIGGNLPFVVAAMFGKTEILKLFLDKDPFLILREGERAFYLACKEGKIETAQFLEERDVFIHAFECGALVQACYHNHIQVVEFIFSKSKSAELSNFAKQSALLCAIRNKKIDFVRKIVMLRGILSLRAFVNYAGSLPLESASRSSFEIVEYLVECGSNITAGCVRAACDIYGREPYRAMKTLKFLYKNGAPPSSSYLVRRMSLCGHVEVVRLLVKGGADANMMSAFDKTVFTFYERIEEKRRIRAANKIGTWWIPICYDTSRDCGKRMMEKEWSKTEKLYGDDV